ncbi:hypothetical protein JCM9279_006805 [Rhodotorula babjevae]
MDYEQNAHLAAAPAYALESDSESDWDDDELRPHSTAAADKQLAPDAVVSLEGRGEAVDKGLEAVFLLGEAGERLAQGFQLDDAARAMKVLVDGDQAGLVIPAAAGAASPTLVFLTTALPLAALHPLAATLLEALQPSTVTIVSSYHLPSYIPPAKRDASSSTSTAPILALSSPSPSPAVTQLRSTGALSPFTTPNLHHGLASSLLTLSHLSPSTTSSTLLLLPTTTPPQPLNGPFSLASPVGMTSGSAGTLYDAGGPTSLSDPGALFRELVGLGAPRRSRQTAAAAATASPGAPLREVKTALGWDWWSPEAQGGTAFEWLERQRKDKRREQAGSMYM